MTSFLPVKPPCIMFCNPSRGIWLPPTMSCWGDHLCHLHLLHLPGHPQQKNIHPWLPLPCQHPNSPHGQKGSLLCLRCTPSAMQEGPSSPKRQEAPTWFTSLKPSHEEAFLWDSSSVKEARSHFFSNNSYDWVHDGTSDLSDVFKELAKSAGLLGEAIYEIQLSWTRPEELKQANYALWSLPKGLRFLRVVPASESPKVMGLMGIHDPDALGCYAGYTYCSWCGKEGQNEGL